MASITFTSTYSAGITPAGTQNTTVNCKITYSETYSASTDKTTIKITDIAFQVVGNQYTYAGLPVYGTVKVNGTTLVTLNAGASNVVTLSGASWCSVDDFTSSSLAISHTSDPKTITIALGGGFAYSGNSYFCALYNGTNPLGVQAQSETVTLATAHWKVSYNANGGTGAPSAQTKKKGQTLTLSSTTPTKSNAVTGSYTVTLNANGGTVSPTSKTADRTTTYSFSKWNTKADGSGTNYNAGASYSTNAAVTLYAQWTTSTSTASVALPTPTRSGYTFNGWYTAASGGTQKTSPYTPTGNTTLYAQWTGQASTIAASGGTKFGTAITLTITRQDASFTHTVTTSCGGHTETLMTKGSSTSLTWTPSAATYAQYVTNSMSASATITCKTYSGNTLIGTTAITRTISFDAADVAPTVSQTRYDLEGYAQNYGAYVQGKSRVRITLTEATVGNATIVSRRITANGATYSTSPADTDVLTRAGAQDVVATITDSRGQTATSSVTIGCYAYSAPAVNTFTAERCNSDGTSNNAGLYFKVNYSVAVSSIGSQNSKALVLKYKKKSVSSYSSSTITLSSYTQSGTSSVIAADANSSYDIRLELTDDFTTTTRNLVLPTAVTHINHGAGADGGIGIGKVSENDKTVEIAEDWNVRLGDVILVPFNLGLGVSIPSNSSLDNYTTRGSFYVASAAVAASVTNSPVTSMGYKLIVFALNANTYIMQMAFTYNGQILRRVKNANGWTGWYKLTMEAV